MEKKLWEVWSVNEKIGSGSFGVVYKCSKEEFGKTYYSAVKHISLPKTEDELNDLKREEGISSTENIKKYYQDTIDDIVKETEIMYELRANKNIADYQDHLIKEKKDGLGYDIYIRMELLTALNKYLETKKVDENMVIQIGIDICSSLEVCDKHNLLHRDIKPANIFIDESGNYKLGDFGIAKRLEKTTLNMSKKGTYNYMAPEIYKGQNADISSDIYSLGMVLYRLLNNNRAPFIDGNLKEIKASDNEKALEERMSGKLIPKIAGVNSKLMNIIITACNFNPKNRYKTPNDMKRDLLKLDDKYDKKFSDSYEKTISIYSEKNDYEKTVSIYDNDENQDDYQKTVSIYDNENLEKNLNQKTVDSVLNEELSTISSDDELRAKIRKIMEEERNNTTIISNEKYIEIEVLKEKSNRIFVLLQLLISFGCAILIFVPNFTANPIRELSLVELVFNEKYYHFSFSALPTIICFAILIAYILSLFGRKYYRISKIMYLFSLYTLFILAIILYNKYYTIQITFFVFFLLIVILYLIPYKWQVITRKESVEEKYIEAYKENNKKIRNEYKKKNKKSRFILRGIIIVIIFIVLLFFTEKNNISQSNPKNSNVEQILVLNDYVFIRQSNDVFSNKIGMVYQDEIFDVLDTIPEDKYVWYKIETKQGVIGYIANPIYDNYLQVIGGN